MFHWLTRKKPDPIPAPVVDYVAEVAKLKDQIKELKKSKEKGEKDLRELQHKKKMEEEDIKHMVRMKEERMEVEQQKKIVELEKEKNEEIAKVKDEYRDKVEQSLEKRGTEIKEMYDEILKRLPDVSVRLKGEA